MSTCLAERPVAARGAGRDLALDYLRAAITVLVVAHHAVFPYLLGAQPLPATLAVRPYWWETYPIVDGQRWSGFSVFVDFDDMFFMSLMFFISGLFVWRGLARKGAVAFLRERIVRLGIPFVVAVVILAPLAYYPTFLQLPESGRFIAYWRQWLALRHWPAGPAWFIWVLLAFDGLAALVFVVAPRAGDKVGRRAGQLARRPVLFCTILVAVSAVLYVPLSLRVMPDMWFTGGPFAFQTSRIFHYLAYFLIAVALGAPLHGTVAGGLSAPDGALAKRWFVWMVSALLVFAATRAMADDSLTALSLSWQIARRLGFVLSCATLCLAWLAVFVRFARVPWPLFDSLTRNAYAIYLLHYAFLTWLQFALLSAPLPALVKATLAFSGALLLSWGLAAALRRLPGVARIL